jgi:hypothetical protein
MDNMESIRQLKITTVELDNVLANNKILFNTNNHWIDGRPANYDAVLDKTHTGNWIDKFHDEYKKIILDSEDLAWMKEALKIGTITRRFPKQFDEEKLQTITKHKPETDIIFRDCKSYFVRSDSVSLKYGKYGAGPYMDFREVIDSIVTTLVGHTCFRESDTECPLYFMKWIPEMNTDLEFRLFIHNNKITAISQQFIFQKNVCLGRQGRISLRSMIFQCCQFYEESIRDKLLYLGGDYTIDMVFLDDNKSLPYFIEPNCFGKEYAAGSALFHWLNDEKQLYGKCEQVEFRYVI